MRVRALVGADLKLAFHPVFRHPSNMLRLLRPGAPGVAAALSLLALLWAGCTREAPPAPTPAATAQPVVTAPAEKPAPPEAPKARCEPLKVDVPALDDSIISAAPQPVLDPSEKGMRNFYERLARVARGNAKDHVRIAVYGDSNMTMDFIAGPLRRRLQASYGDGGHGFIALARPWSHYRHMDVVQTVGAAFDQYAITTKPTGDGAYGIAGIVSDTSSPGAKVTISTASPPSPVGLTASRFDVFWLKGPKRGEFDVVVDGETKASLASEAPERGVGVHRVEVPDGPHAFQTVVRTGRWTRFLGSAMERTTPGVVVDNLGVGAMNTQCIILMDPAVAHPILEHRRYDLVILMTGTADIYQTDVASDFVREVVARHRKANPNVSFLLVAPPDRGVSHATRNLLKLGVQRKELASEIEVGFWDLLHAMGGPTSMMTFIRKSHALPDQIHFSESGGAWVGNRLHHALMAGFAEYAAKHEEAGCGELDTERPPIPVGDFTPATTADAGSIAAFQRAKR